eukprot:GEMP01046536.1.p1 GENE.GEMP01046536.1~~GEMP01046536.1.p1  ORF type:complete len:482 (+),score=116.21 GEMP01046536.1:143-1447(+)
MASGAVTSPPLAQQRLPQHVDPTSPPGTIIIDSPRTPPLPSAFSPSTGRSAVRHCTSFSPALRARLDTIAGRARGGTAAEASPTALRRRIRQAMERCSVLDTDQNDSKSVSKKQRLYDAVQRAAASTERTSGAVESSPHGKALSRVLRLRNLIAPPTDGARRFAMTPRADSSGSPVARLGPSARTASSSVGDISPRPGSYLRGKHWTAHMLEKLSQNRLQHGIQDKPQHVIPKSPPATATIPALQEQHPRGARLNVFRSGGDPTPSISASTMDRFMSPGRALWIGTPRFTYPEDCHEILPADLSPLHSPVAASVRPYAQPSAAGSEGGGGTTRRLLARRREPAETAKVAQSGDQGLILQSLWDRLIYESAIIRADVTEWEEQSIIIQRLAQLLMIEEDPSAKVSCLGQMLDEDRKRIFYGYGTELLRLLPVLPE